MLLVPTDSASAALLRLANMPATAPPGPHPLLCPGGTEADGRRAASAVGYSIHIVLSDSANTTARQLRVMRGCSYRYRGQLLPFAEGAEWELRRDGGRWRVVATSYHWVT